MINGLKKFWGCFLLVLAIDSQAQSVDNTTLSQVVRVNILNPGLSYELPVSRMQTLLMAGGLNTSFGVGFSSSLGTSAFISFVPGVNAQYRFYYNARKRHEKGKRTAMNSLNYIAPAYEVLFSAYNVDEDAIDEESHVRPIHTIGAVWGIQRNYKTRFSLDLSLGIGYQIAESTYYDAVDQYYTSIKGTPTAIIKLQLGIWVNKKG
ncbi:hypothetical protein [Flavihumibacter fluvii]|uniref:hypothetical protein n=1 Tax=Flavihumibacter fluvii TaxID=2838157 RepID=UPI001BDE5F67|nr:hypothetical protein [Flavihumibacter fluvii]ULQ50865.1 hypothetical protein KJS93_12300 [Flavihumibacter fluvii]